MRYALVISLACATAAPAQTAEPEIVLELATDLCLRYTADETAILPAFEAAGYRVSEWVDAGTYVVSAPGMTGLVTPQPYATQCALEAQGVPHATGVAVVQRAAARLYGDKVGYGHPAGKAVDCPMFQVFAPGRLMIVEVFSAGNGGVCDDPGSTGILVQ